MASKSHETRRFGSLVDKPLPSLALQSHQLEAVLNPATSIQTLADRGSVEREGEPRPIKVGAREQRRVNDALARGAENRI